MAASLFLQLFFFLKKKKPLMVLKRQKRLLIQLAVQKNLISCNIFFIIIIINVGVRIIGKTNHLI
jgi:hypothetical protein